LVGNVDDEYAAYVPLNGTFADPGYESKDNKGNDLEVTVKGTVSTSTAGVYYLNYNVGAISMRRKVVVYKSVYDFDYTGNYQVFTAPVDGKYQIELWGAGVPSGNGKGAYTKGNIYLSKGETMYVYVGESSNVQNAESFNCGIANQGGYPGGGATDIRLVQGNWKNINSLRSRIMIAAGGGSGNVAGSHGGALTGLYPGVATGGTQTSPGTTQSTAYYSAAFGVAGGGCSGGGGYYGGGGATCASGGAGGSSFISGYTGCNAITTTGTHTGQPYHYSGYRFIDMEMKTGNDATMPNPAGGTMTGKTGNGYARITVLNTNSDNSLSNVRYIYNQINGSNVQDCNHWVEIQAFDKNGANLASGKANTSNANFISGYPSSRITDGDLDSNAYADAGCGHGLEYVRVDLGAEYDLSSIRLWHYYADGRTYYENQTRVAGNNLVYRTLHSSNYPETANGFIIRAVPTD
jgi:FlaG/FlaF family flagellin (archaellin)